MKVGEYLEIEDAFLTNTPSGQRHPRSLPWEYILICRTVKKFRATIHGKVKRWETRDRHVRTLNGRHQVDVDRQLEKLVKQKAVKVVEETHR